MAIALVIGELVAGLTFHLLKRYLGTKQSGDPNWESVLKGILERTTLLVGLLAGFPHVLTAYGALKISTRLSEDQKIIYRTPTFSPEISSLSCSRWFTR
jgi:hypothetical protein